MSENKFGLLRRILRGIGLSEQASNDAVNFIADLLTGESKSADVKASPDFPYYLCEHFLSPAELNFYTVLRGVVGIRANLCTKVGLGDIFQVKAAGDQSRYRIYTNKIDRKHVDFLLCDSATMRPLLGIELDDSSHQRADRQERDTFVDQVFAAAGLPILHIPVRRAYDSAEIAAQIAPFIGGTVKPSEAVSIPKSSDTVKLSKMNIPKAPVCPKCGAPMQLRTAKSGANAGNRFWGCSNYPTCHAMQPYQEEK